jgi:hypothetical protein
MMVFGRFRLEPVGWHLPEALNRCFRRLKQGGSFPKCGGRFAIIKLPVKFYG